jgi:hypothetical protein
MRRLGIAQHVAGQRFPLDQQGDRHLEILYNARILPDGQLSFGAVRVGQGEEWRDYWLSLTSDIGVENTLDAVQMAARLLRCPTLVVGLASAIGSGEGQLKTLAMNLRALLEKSSDAELLREMIGFTAQRLMELEVEGLTGRLRREQAGADVQRLCKQMQKEHASHFVMQ